MKKLMNTLYVLSEGNYLSLKGENVVIQNGENNVGRFPLHTLENIFVFSYKGASPALMGACAEKNIGMCYFTPKGKFLAKTVGKSHGNVLLRREQYRIADDLERSCAVARNMIIGKIFNCRWSIERTLRDHKFRVDEEKMRGVSIELQEGMKKLYSCSELDTLRGVEGQLASRYFQIFDNMIINQKDIFAFDTRNRRPPLDKVNALLSFTYSIIGSECGNALESVGLDSYVGFLHRDRPGRQSLALDLLEELRGIMADRFVLSIINNKIMKAEHFQNNDDKAVLLNDEGRRQFFTFWQKKKKEEITHPYLKEKIPWGLVPYVQALLLARTIRRDIDQYPPFLWK